MQKFSARTDLASEAYASIVGGVDGIICKELHPHGLRAELVSILSDEAAEALGKPKGEYYTLYLDDFVRRRSVSFSDCAQALAQLMRELPAIGGSRRFLVACLGNRDVTPDALGPCAADSIIVTRHLKSSLPEDFAAFSDVSVVRTGVLGTTGIESAEEIRAMCRIVEPDCVIAVDALAAGELSRLCRNIQICDTGIAPGAGVGNDRARLDASFLGIPVVAVGVPTVIDLSAFTDDESARGMFVTPRGIDELVHSTARLIAYGIDLALHEGLSVDDVDLLVE